MPETEKYPADSGRRRFVKGVVGGSALSAAGAVGAAVVNSATDRPGAGGGLRNYFAIENTAGPAPRGMPMIPVEVDAEGFLTGRFPDWETVERQGTSVRIAETEIAGYTYSSEWFQYCGAQEAPGLAPEGADDQDEYFRYTTPPPEYEWQNTRVEVGERMHVDHFGDYETWGNGVGTSGIGKPAKGTWRSQGVDPGDGQLVVQLLRIPPDRFDAMLAGTEYPDWLEAASAEGFVAWLDKCTHFCCVPTFKGTTQSAGFDAADRAYCACHQSVYDPYTVVRRAFTALPRPE
jgi:Rieske Fe-S protein